MIHNYQLFHSSPSNGIQNLQNNYSYNSLFLIFIFFKLRLLFNVSSSSFIIYLSFSSLLFSVSSSNPNATSNYYLY